MKVGYLHGRPCLVVLEFGVNTAGPDAWDALARRVAALGEQKNGDGNGGGGRGGGPAVINLVTYNFCRLDDGSNGVDGGFSFDDCRKRLRAGIYIHPPLSLDSQLFCFFYF